MKYAKIATLFALPIVFAVTLGAVPPAAAQTAQKLKCNGCVKSRHIANNKVKGKDLKPTISIGTSSNDGDLSVKSTAGTPTVSLDGDSGDVTNSLSGDGLVKAWARINANGSVITCFRCNMDPAETRKIPASTGEYEVDFTPLGTDISSRPRVCTSEIFSPTTPAGTDDNICNTSTSGDSSTVNVHLWDGGQAANTSENDQFTIIIF